jgi:phosphocarrier protein HPr
MGNRIIRTIRLRPDEAKEFVKVACTCDFDIDIAYNRYIVDAKSILGVLGLDFSQTLTVSYEGYNRDLESFLKAFAFAC